MNRKIDRTNVQAMLQLLLFLIIHMQAARADVLHGCVLDAENTE